MYGAEVSAQSRKQPRAHIRKQTYAHIRKETYANSCLTPNFAPSSAWRSFREEATRARVCTGKRAVTRIFHAKHVNVQEISANESSEDTPHIKT
jgi:hypothetical protein